MQSRTRSAAKADETAHQAVSRLFDQYGSALYSLARRLCRGPEEAEDLVQDVFVTALQKWNQFEGRSNPQTWLCTIASRACRRRHRRRSGQPQRIASLDQLSPFKEERIAALADGASDSLSRSEQQESFETLQDAILKLPDAYRLPLVFKDVLGMSIRDVARALGLKEGTVKARVHRTRLLLRKAIIRNLPTLRAPSWSYPLQICRDLISAKQNALDRGTPFPVDDHYIDKTMCDRCKSVCATLDLTHALCVELARGEIPLATRNRLRARFALCKGRFARAPA